MAGRALVIGAGRSGVAIARYLAGQGTPVRVVDAGRPALPPALPEGVETVFGGYGLEVLEGSDAVYASPGVPWDDPILMEARRRGHRVSSEIDLFFRLCPAPIIGITGTNGKTTTTALVGDVMRRGRRPVLVGGNIGETVLDRLSEVTPEHWLVLELSSFQLESIEYPRCRIAAVLNVTPDHLDRHRTLEAYAAIKARAVEFMEPGDVAVLNGRDRLVADMASRTRGRLVWFDALRPDPPMPVPGEHNLMNARAAAAIGLAAGIPRSDVDAAIAAFRGVEHRLELVGEWGGIRWYNDSKATNPDAGLVAVRAFPGQRLVLIAGGQGADFDLAGWSAEVRRTTHAVVVMGATAAAIEAALAGHRVLRAASLEEAVALAAAEAAPGGVVLLSPAHKSFDMFRSYEDRGRQFKALVHARHGEGTR